MDENLSADSVQEPVRRNRARERHLRRKGVQTGMAAPSNVPRQIKPAGGFAMPEIHLPANSRLILYGLAGGIFLILVVMFIGNLKPADATAGPNAIWIGTQYTYDAPTDAAVNDLVSRLRDHQIGTVYAWVSLLQGNVWSDTQRLDRVKAFAEQFKRLYPEATLYGWLSVDAQVSTLNDAPRQQIVADFSQRMTGEFGFDGVMLNVVPVLNGDEDYLTLLRKVRASVGDDSLLSVAVPPDWSPLNAGIPVPPQIEPGTIWGEEYKQRVALIANQMVISAYNSGLGSADDYSSWMAYQVQIYARAIADLNTTTELLIGVPAYAAQLPIHDPAVENVQSAIDGIQTGLAAAGDASTYVRGLALYNEWEKSADDWSQFKALWLR